MRQGSPPAADGLGRHPEAMLAANELLPLSVTLPPKFARITAIDSDNVNTRASVRMSEMSWTSSCTDPVDLRLATSNSLDRSEETCRTKSMNVLPLATALRETVQNFDHAGDTRGFCQHKH